MFTITILPSATIGEPLFAYMVNYLRAKTGEGRPKRRYGSRIEVIE